MPISRIVSRRRKLHHLIKRLFGVGGGDPDGVMLDADSNFMIFADGSNAEYV